MRKIFFAALLSLLLIPSSQTQAQVKLGLKGGVNITSMKFSSDVPDANTRAGFFIGPTLLVKVPMTGLGFDISALYDQRDAKLKNGDDVSDDKLKRQSIDIPINLRYSFGLSSLASFYLFAGPQFGFNIGHKITSIADKAAEWKLKESDFSVNVGAGLLLLSKLQFSVNYNIACDKTGNINMLDTVDYLDNSKGRANAWQIGMAYYF